MQQRLTAVRIQASTDRTTSGRTDSSVAETAPSTTANRVTTRWTIRLSIGSTVGVAAAVDVDVEATTRIARTDRVVPIIPIERTDRVAASVPNGRNVPIDPIERNAPIDPNERSEPIAPNGRSEQNGRSAQNGAIDRVAKSSRVAGSRPPRASAFPTLLMIDSKRTPKVTVRSLRQTLVAIFLLMVVAENVAAADEATRIDRRFYASVGTGFDFNRGDFGEDINTNTASIPFFVKLEWEPVTFRASASALYIDGSDQISGEGDEGRNDGMAGDRQSFGVGDITTSLTYTYYPERHSALPIVDLIVKVKIHTASPDDMGSSGTDWTLGTELAKTFGPLSVFGGAHYRRKTGGQFDDIWLASAGASVKIAKWISIGGAYDFRKASTSRSTDSHEVSPFVSLRMSEHVRLTPYGVIGLSDGAPDWGFGSTVSYQF